VKIRLVIVLAIAIVVGSELSAAHTHPLADVKSQAPTDSSASAAKQIADVKPVDSRPSPDNATLIVEFQFPAPEIDPTLAEYLDLTETQISAMQLLLSQERREIDPLKTRLRSTHGKLLVATEQNQSKDIRILAATEARILTKLITKSFRAQAKLHGLLTNEQQKKLEDLNRLP